MNQEELNKSVAEFLKTSGKEDLTKREHYASMFLQGFISANKLSFDTWGNYLKLSVTLADALIKELEND